MASPFTYEKWRHGGWYVLDVRYITGAVGCVSRNYPDGKWRIACHRAPFEDQPTFRSRDEAAAAEITYARSPEVVRADLAQVREWRDSRLARGASQDDPTIVQMNEQIAEGEALLV